MSEYTVKSGENLWNICKREFKLSNNTDIANKVNEIAKSNGISNANNIFIGQKINLGTTNPVVNNGEQKNYSNEINQAVANKIKYNNLQTYDDITRLEASSVSIFGADIKTDEQKNNAYTDYSSKLLIDYYDDNGDGVVSVEEFQAKEQAGGLKANDLTFDKLNADAIAMGGKAMSISDEEKNQYNLIAQRTANLFAQNLDINNNGMIDANELAFLNKYADGLDGKEDGVIYASNESVMAQSIMGTNAENKKYNEVINKYLLGQTLTVEEEQILKEAQSTIKKSLSKASGINIEG